MFAGQNARLWYLWAAAGSRGENGGNIARMRPGPSILVEDWLLSIGSSQWESGLSEYPIGSPRRFALPPSKIGMETEAGLAKNYSDTEAGLAVVGRTVPGEPIGRPQRFDFPPVGTRWSRGVEEDANLPASAHRGR